MGRRRLDRLLPSWINKTSIIRAPVHLRSSEIDELQALKGITHRWRRRACESSRGRKTRCNGHRYGSLRAGAIREFLFDGVSAGCAANVPGLMAEVQRLSSYSP